MRTNRNCINLAYITPNHITTWPAIVYIYLLVFDFLRILNTLYLMVKQAFPFKGLVFLEYLMEVVPGQTDLDPWDLWPPMRSRLMVTTGKNTPRSKTWQRFVAPSSPRRMPRMPAHPRLTWLVNYKGLKDGDLKGQNKYHGVWIGSYRLYDQWHTDIFWPIMGHKKPKMHAV